MKYYKLNNDIYYKIYESHRTFYRAIRIQVSNKSIIYNYCLSRFLLSQASKITKQEYELQKLKIL